MLTLFLFAVQSAAQPDIQLDARVLAERVTVERNGEASLTVRAEPDGGSEADVERTPERRSQRTLRNVDIHLKAEVRIADPVEARERQETSTPDPR